MADGSDLERVVTGDGSETLHSRRFGEIYHSRHGAVTESLHVFIGAGLKGLAGREVAILEVGFGTGLNAFLAARWARDGAARVSYLGIEAEPPPAALVAGLQLGEAVAGAADAALWQAIGAAPWEVAVDLLPTFRLHKRQARLEDVALECAAFEVVFFDAFAPTVQPELWTAERFSALHAALRPGGRLVTYCAKGAVRRAMQAAGFRVEKLPGPPGKREMLRAWA